MIQYRFHCIFNIFLVGNITWHGNRRAAGCLNFCHDGFQLFLSPGQKSHLRALSRIGPGCIGPQSAGCPGNDGYLPRQIKHVHFYTILHLFISVQIFSIKKARKSDDS